MGRYTPPHLFLEISVAQIANEKGREMPVKQTGYLFTLYRPRSGQMRGFSFFLTRRTDQEDRRPTRQSGEAAITARDIEQFEKRGM